MNRLTSLLLALALAIAAPGQIAPPPAGSGVQYVTTDQSITSSTSLTAITGLSFSLAAATTYHVHVYLQIAAGATGGFTASLFYSGTYTGTSRAQWFVMDNDPALVGAGACIINTNCNSGAFNFAGNTVYILQLDGSFTTNASGTMTINFAQSVSNGTATTIRAGSFAELSK